METPVRDFVSENPGVNYSGIVARFGTPEQIAESRVAEMEVAELLQGIQIRKKVLIIAVIAVMLLVMMRIGVHVAAYLEFTKDMRGYAVVDVIEVEREIFDEGGN